MFSVCAGKRRQQVVQIVFQIVFTTCVSVPRAPPHPPVKHRTMDTEITETGTDHPSKSDANPGWDGSEAEGEASRSLGEGRGHTRESLEQKKLQIHQCVPISQPVYDSVKIHVQIEADKAKK